jgi:hypothetical protein
MKIIELMMMRMSITVLNYFHFCGVE